MMGLTTLAANLLKAIWYTMINHLVLNRREGGDMQGVMQKLFFGCCYFHTCKFSIWDVWQGRTDDQVKQLSAEGW